MSVLEKYGSSAFFQRMRKFYSYKRGIRLEFWEAVRVLCASRAQEFMEKRNLCSKLLPFIHFTFPVYSCASL